MKVGTICKLKVDCLDTKPGTLGVVFYDYGDGYQVIFENGTYAGFSTSSSALTAKTSADRAQTEAEQFLEEVGFEESLGSYQFKNVMQVSADYRKGVFNTAWSEKWQGTTANILRKHKFGTEKLAEYLDKNYPKESEIECTCDLNTLVSSSELEGDPLITHYSMRFHYCPLHFSAAALLVACCKRVRVIEEVYAKMGKKPSGPMYQMMKEAIAEAEK